MIKKYFIVVFAFIPAVLFSQIWNKVGGGLYTDSTIGGNVYELKKIGDTLFVGGGFAIYPGDALHPLWSGFTGSRNIVKWSGYQWDTIPRIGPDSSGPNGLVTAVEYYNNELYIGGNIPNDWKGYPPKVKHLTRWDGAYWQQVGGGNPNGRVESMINYQGELYVGGEFGQVGGNVPANLIARWNGTNWSKLGSGLVGDFSTAAAMAVYNDDLYVGGRFTNAGGKPTFNIARWNGTQWSDLDTGVASDVTALAVDTINNLLYVGGGIYSAGGNSGINADGIVKWDGFKWIYGGYSPAISSLAIYHNEIFAGNYNVDDTIIRRFDGEQWHPVEGGPAASIVALEVYNDELYVGGGYWMRLSNGDSTWALARYYAPPDTTCKYIQPLINTMLADTNILKDVFYLDTTGKAEVKFYNNNKYASSWQWDFGDSGTDTVREPLHTYTTAGVYDVSITITHPHNYANKVCTKTVSKTITIEPPLAIKEETIDEPDPQLKIYPNPTGGSFTIEIQNEKIKFQNTKIEIFDVRGKLVKEIKQVSEKTEVENKGWTKGSYAVNLVVNGKIFATEKVILR